MATTLSQLRTQVRRDIHDLLRPQEQYVPISDISLSTFPIPTIGPIITGTFALDIDGVTVNPATYTLYEQGYVTLSTPPAGTNLHATFQFARYSNEDLTQFIQEAIREFSLVQPKLGQRRRTPISNLQTATLSSPYTPGDLSFVVTSTAGYDPRGLLSVGGINGAAIAIYLYSSIDATHFYLDTSALWSGPDRAWPVGQPIIQDDNTVHGWVLDPNQVRFVYTLQGYEPADEFGIGSGYQDIAYFSYDEVTGYVHIEFDFSQLETGNAGSATAPLDQFRLATGEYYFNPVNDTDSLDIPDYALNPISWLAGALAIESREPDRDFSWKEQTGADTTADPTRTFMAVGESLRKKWDTWVAKQFRPFPRSRRRISQL